jgi:hypothetical protein
MSVEVDLSDLQVLNPFRIGGVGGDIGLDLELGGVEGGVPLAVNFGLTGVNPFGVNLGPLDITLRPLDITLRPLTVDLGLNDINLDIGSEPNKPLVVDLGLDNVKIDLGLDNIKVDLGLDNINACLSLAVTELPRVRVHMPTKSEFGFNLFGKPIFSFTFKGDAMVATEDNPPRVFLQPEEGAPPTHDDSEVAYTVTLGDESDET